MTELFLLPRRAWSHVPTCTRTTEERVSDTLGVKNPREEVQRDLVLPGEKFKDTNLRDKELNYKDTKL